MKYENFYAGGLILIILNSCGTSSEYTPVGTNCKKYSYSTFEMFLDIILGNNENENGDYDPNFDYKQCLKNEKLKIDKQNNIKEGELTLI